MRAAPPLRVTVERFGVWQSALAALIAASLAVVGAWCWAGSGRPPLQSALALLATLIAVAAAAFRLRPTPFVLRWTGEQWQVDSLASASNRDGPTWSGDIHVALDFGSWMLLKFTSERGSWRCPYRWLPVQRRGLEAAWHPLRCAVYSARPAARPSSLAPAATHPTRPPRPTLPNEP